MVLTPDADGCYTARAREGNELVLRLTGPGTFRVRGNGLLGLRLRDDTSRAQGEIVYSLLPPQHEQVVSASVAGGRLVVTLSTEHPTVLCDLVQ